MSEFLFTSESVSEGHPDKVADQISDAVLDTILEQDPHARVAAETLVTTGLVVMSGEITTGVSHDYARVARDTIRRIGYNDPELRFDTDAFPDLLRAPPGAAPKGGAQGRTPHLVAPGRQVAGHRALRRRQAGRCRHGRALDAASSEHERAPAGARRSRDRGDHQAGDPG